MYIKRLLLTPLFLSFALLLSARGALIPVKVTLRDGTVASVFHKGEINVLDTIYTFQDSKGNKAEYNIKKIKSLYFSDDDILLMAEFPQKLLSKKIDDPSEYPTFIEKVYEGKHVLGFTRVLHVKEGLQGSHITKFYYRLKDDKAVVNYYNIDSSITSVEAGTKLRLKLQFKQRFPELVKYIYSKDFDKKAFKADPLSILHVLDGMLD